MTTDIKIADARRRFTRLPALFRGRPGMGAVRVTNRGQAVMAVLSWDFYETLCETLEVMGDRAAMEDLRRSARDLSRGKTVPWKTARARLRL